MSATTTTTDKPIVETYALRLNGRHIRMATRVMFPDGRKVEFMERTSKRDAIRQALRELSR